MWRTGDGMGLWMLFGTLWAVVLAVLFVWLVARVATTASGGGVPAPRDDPMDIARTRYARGEIDRDEFVRIRQDLEARAGT